MPPGQTVNETTMISDMKLKRFVAVVVCALWCGSAFAQSQDMEKEISVVAEKLAAQVKESGKKKVTILDFTDLQGNSSELGRFVAEQLSVSLVERRSGFSVMDRANLKSILIEHKLTVDGLVEPENAKKLGQFSGVDAIVLGNVTPLEDQVAIVVKMIATDTAEILGAARGRITKSKEIEQLLGRGIDTKEGTPKGNSLEKERDKDYEGKAKFQKFDNLSVDLDSFRILQDGTILVTVVMSNTATASIQVGLNATIQNLLISKLLDGEGYEWRAGSGSATGISAPHCYGSASTGYQSFKQGTLELEHMTPIGIGKAIKITVRFGPASREQPIGSEFKLQMEIIVLKQAVGGRYSVELNNVFIEGIKPVMVAK
jgi:TolB-like protein